MRRQRFMLGLLASSATLGTAVGVACGGKQDPAPGTGTCLPACFTDIVAGCPPGGSCTVQGPNTCWSNGIRAVRSTMGGSPIVTVIKEGRTCYTVELSGNNHVYKSAAGTFTAVVAFNPMTPRLWTVGCRSQSHEVDFDGPSCRDQPAPAGGGAASAGTMCVSGNCM